MSLGTDVNKAWLEGALSRDPLDLEAHLEWLSHLLPRWGGAPGETLPFARAALARAPRRHRLGCVIAMAYVNVWADADRADCLETPEIRAELRAAADHSILDPAYAFAPGWQYDFNLFAMALAMAKRATRCVASSARSMARTPVGPGTATSRSPRRCSPATTAAPEGRQGRCPARPAHPPSCSSASRSSRVAARTLPATAITAMARTMLIPPVVSQYTSSTLSSSAASSTTSARPIP